MARGSAASGCTGSEAGSIVDTRAKYGASFGPRTPPRTVYVGETAFRRPIATSAVAAHQFSFLSHLSAVWPTVSVHIVPADLSYPPGLAGSFTHYTMRAESISIIEQCIVKLSYESPQSIR